MANKFFTAATAIASAPFGGHARRNRLFRSVDPWVGEVTSGAVALFPPTMNSEAGPCTVIRFRVANTQRVIASALRTQDCTRAF